MTCVVGYIDKSTSRVYIAADSAASDGDCVSIRKDGKVFAVKDMLFGFAGSYRMGQILRYVDDIPHQQKFQEDHEFLCTTFVDYLVEKFDDSKSLSNDNGCASLGQFLLVVAYRGMLYHIDSDFQVAIEDKPYCSIGSGSSYALGAMYALEGYRIKPEKRLSIAIEAAIQNSIGVRPPIQISYLEK